MRRAILGLMAILLLVSAAHAAAPSVRVGIPSIVVTLLPLPVAQERGFFQEEGLTVQPVLMAAALNIKALLSGDVSYATTVGAAVICSKAWAGVWVNR
ncbi:MAG: ABC transporter substrate-binding protein [Deltaproteobacteria bacterium]|nr:ABC transporter substrate-binding protein [Deltaproteobacteria bacterium]